MPEGLSGYQPETGGEQEVIQVEAGLGEMNKQAEADMPPAAQRLGAKEAAMFCIAMTALSACGQIKRAPVMGADMQKPFPASQEREKIRDFSDIPGMTDKRAEEMDLPDPSAVTKSLDFDPKEMQHGDYKRALYIASQIEMKAKVLEETREAGEDTTVAANDLAMNIQDAHQFRRKYGKKGQTTADYFDYNTVPEDVIKLAYDKYLAAREARKGKKRGTRYGRKRQRQMPKHEQTPLAQK